MPTKKSKGRTLATVGNRKAPPPASAMTVRPPPVPNKETMSSAVYSSAMSFHMAHYPSYGFHSSASTKAPARPTVGGGSQVEKMIFARSWLVVCVMTMQPLKQRGQSSILIKNVYAIFDPSITSTSSLTCSPSMIETGVVSLPIHQSRSKTTEKSDFSRSGSQGCKGTPRLQSCKVLNSCRNISSPAPRRRLHDNIHTKDCTLPPSCHDEASFATSLGADNPYVSASAARKVARDKKIAADKKIAEEIRRKSKIKEFTRRHSELAKLEARYANNHEMGDREEELAVRCSVKKGVSCNGRADPSSINNASTSKYSSLMRVSKTSKKRNQVSSPAAHYSGCPAQDDNSTSVVEYFESGGGAKQTLALAIANSKRLSEGKNSQQEEVANLVFDDDNIDGVTHDFLPASDDDNGEYKFGNDAHGSTPLASTPPVPDETCVDKDNKDNEDNYDEESDDKVQVEVTDPATSDPASVPDTNVPALPVQHNPVVNNAKSPSVALPSSPPLAALHLL
jgi:hypothetical protein